MKTTITSGGNAMRLGEIRGTWQRGENQKQVFGSQNDSGNCASQSYSIALSTLGLPCGKFRSSTFPLIENPQYPSSMRYFT